VRLFPKVGAGISYHPCSGGAWFRWWRPWIGYGAKGVTIVGSGQYRNKFLTHRSISQSQTAFVKGRFIQDGPLALHEIIHELKSKNLPAVLLKLDFEKAYDRVNWQFLREVLLIKGFEPAFVHRLMQLVSGGQTAISINGEIGPYFRNKRGVRQGDPISPLLFNFVADALAAILDRAKVAGHIKGVVPHLIPGRVSHLQYADDTMILIQNTQESLTNLKFLLLCFELLSGMKINFHKSEVIVMGAGEAEQARVARLLNCKQGKFPFTYLGFTMSDHKLSMADVEPLVASVGKRAAPWQGRFMSSAARLTLIDACLLNLPLHTMGLFLLADGSHAAMDSHRSRFFWEGQSAVIRLQRIYNF
jgi:hypothetical protein